MNRRGFLGLLGGVAATAVLDPERLLWRPGTKLISIPKPIMPPPPIAWRLLVDGQIVCDVHEITLSGLLDTMADQSGCTWGVDPITAMVHFNRKPLAQGARLRTAAGKNGC